MKRVCVAASKVTPGEFSYYYSRLFNNNVFFLTEVAPMTLSTDCPSSSTNMPEGLIEKVAQVLLPLASSMTRLEHKSDVNTGDSDVTTIS